MSEKTKKIIRILALLIFVLPYAFEKSEEDGNKKITVRALLWEDQVGIKDGKLSVNVHFPYGKPNLLDRLSDRKENSV